MSGLHDLGRLGSIWLPALEARTTATRRLDRIGARETWRLTAPPRALDPDEDVAAAYADDPIAIPRSEVLRVANARLIREPAAVVGSADGRMLEEGIPSQIRVRDMLSLHRAAFLGARRSVAGPTCVLATYGIHSYYHFFFDAVSRLYAFSDGGRANVAQLRANTRGISFLLDAHGPAWQRSFLDLLGLEHSTIAFTPRTNLVVDDLVLPTYLIGAHPRVTAHVLLPAAADWLRRVFREAAGAEGERPSRRFYVTRRSAPTRRLVNEPEVGDLLASYGFETVDPGTLTPLEQIRTFAAAELVVAPHGAGMTNILFAQPCPVIDITSPQLNSPALYLLADALGHEYWYVRGTVGADQPLDFTADYAVEPATLEATLGAVLSTGTPVQRVP